MADDPKAAARKRLRNRNWALLAVLVALIVVFYLITLVRLGGPG
jgi:type VI protein secretion system component VasF